MWDKKTRKPVSIEKYLAMWLIAGFSVFSAKEVAALTANDVLNKMSGKEQTAFIGGIVGGFAYMRWLRDRPDESGMSCINNWFYGDGDESWKRIDAWFSRHLDKQAEPLIYVLIKKECGE